MQALFVLIFCGQICFLKVGCARFCLGIDIFRSQELMFLPGKSGQKPGFISNLTVDIWLNKAICEGCGQMPGFFLTIYKLKKNKLYIIRRKKWVFDREDIFSKKPLRDFYNGYDGNLLVY